MTKEEKIQQAADEHNTHESDDYNAGFIHGATSSAAKEYWQEYYFDFTKWISENRYRNSVRGDGTFYKQGIYYSIERLYELFNLKNKK